MDFDLLKYVRTVSDAELLNNEIDILIDSLYRTGERSFDKTINKSVRKEIAKALETIGPSKSGRKADLQRIKEDLKKLNVLRLTLAFEPSQLVIEKTIKWLRENVSGDIVVNILYDPAIVGGAIIEYQGKYIDMSLKKKLDNADFSNFL